MFRKPQADGVMTLTINVSDWHGPGQAQSRCRTAYRSAAAIAAGGPAPWRTNEKTSPNLLMVVHLESPDNRYDMCIYNPPFSK